VVRLRAFHSWTDADLVLGALTTVLFVGAASAMVLRVPALDGVWWLVPVIGTARATPPPDSRG
jgi:hypothetical protein